MADYIAAHAVVGGRIYAKHRGISQRVVMGEFFSRRTVRGWLHRLCLASNFVSTSC